MQQIHARNLYIVLIFIDINEALLRKLPEPVDWNRYPVEIRNAYQLRSAICESNGDIYLQDPITGVQMMEHCPFPSYI